MSQGNMLAGGGFIDGENGNSDLFLDNYTTEGLCASLPVLGVGGDFEALLHSSLPHVPSTYMAHPHEAKLAAMMESADIFLPLDCEGLAGGAWNPHEQHASGAHTCGVVPLYGGSQLPPPRDNQPVAHAPLSSAPTYGRANSDRQAGAQSMVGGSLLVGCFSGPQPSSRHEQPQLSPSIQSSFDLPPGPVVVHVGSLGGVAGAATLTLPPHHASSGSGRTSVPSGPGLCEARTAPAWLACERPQHSPHPSPSTACTQTAAAGAPARPVQPRASDGFAATRGSGAPAVQRQLPIEPGSYSFGSVGCLPRLAPSDGAVQLEGFTARRGMPLAGSFLPPLDAVAAEPSDNTRRLSQYASGDAAGHADIGSVCTAADARMLSSAPPATCWQGQQRQPLAPSEFLGAALAGACFTDKGSEPTQPQWQHRISATALAPWAGVQRAGVEAACVDVAAATAHVTIEAGATNSLYRASTSFLPGCLPEVGSLLKQESIAMPGSEAQQAIGLDRMDTLSPTSSAALAAFFAAAEPPCTAGHYSSSEAAAAGATATWQPFDCDLFAPFTLDVKDKNSQTAMTAPYAAVQSLPQHNLPLSPSLHEPDRLFRAISAPSWEDDAGAPSAADGGSVGGGGGHALGLGGRYEIAKGLASSPEITSYADECGRQGWSAVTSMVEHGSGAAAFGAASLPPLHASWVPPQGPPSQPQPFSAQGVQVKVEGTPIPVDVNRLPAPAAGLASGWTFFQAGNAYPGAGSGPLLPAYDAATGQPPEERAPPQPSHGAGGDLTAEQQLGADSGAAAGDAQDNPGRGAVRSGAGGTRASAQSVARVAVASAGGAPVSGGGRGGKAARGRRGGITLSQVALRQYYHLPIKRVAPEVGLSLSCLKKECRRLGVPRWPARKLNCLTKMRDTLMRDGSMPARAKQDVLDLMQSNVDQIMANPDAPIFGEFTKLRHDQYKSRSGSRGGGGGGAARRRAAGRGGGRRADSDQDDDEEATDGDSGSEAEE